MSSAAAGAVPARRRLPGARRMLRLAERAFAVTGLLLVVYHIGFHLSVISSASMAPTLQGESLLNGDMVLAEKVSYWFRKPRRWEVVMFRDDDGMLVMKRVVGLPGETIAIRDWDKGVLINGAPVAQPRSLETIKYLAYGNLTGGKAVACSDGYFIMGDDSKDSQDSRFTGPLKPQRIRARAWLLVRPLSRFGFVNR